MNLYWVKYEIREGRSDYKFYEHFKSANIRTLAVKYLRKFRSHRKIARKKLLYLYNDGNYIGIPVRGC